MSQDLQFKERMSFMSSSLYFFIAILAVAVGASGVYREQWSTVFFAVGTVFLYGILLFVKLLERALCRVAATIKTEDL